MSFDPWQKSLFLYLSAQRTEKGKKKQKKTETFASRELNPVDKSLPCKNWIICSLHCKYAHSKHIFVKAC